MFKILLESLHHILVQRLLAVYMAEQYSRAVSERCGHWEELIFPHDLFHQWQYVSLCLVWPKCWWTESTCPSASSTINTVTNTIITAIITITIIPLPSSLSALDWICTHIPTICMRWVADFARKYESQAPNFYFFCGIQNCDCQSHHYEELWDLIVVGTIKISFTLSY